ncbi:MAG: DNA-directed RNA polymerase subunit beta [Candidatus Eisenbacteria sp.]|nr:DNA-directed RNA polymerase subunit beta [Candidatus Eisenbacteria bacterium]
MDLPNLIEVQLQSFRSFLQVDVSPEKRRRQGLQGVFQDIFPISDARGNFSLEFVQYTIGDPKYSVEECQERDVTFAVPLKAVLRLVIREGSDEKKEVRDIIEQEVYLGELPIITDIGTFIINGAERVIVSQLHRSPGVFFEGETHASGKRLYSARVIPYRGSWVEFALDVNDQMFVLIDRKRKLPVTILLRGLGYATDEAILDLFYDTEKIKIAGQRMGTLSKFVGRVTAKDVVDKKTGEVLLGVSEELTEALLESLRAAKVKTITLLVDREERDNGVLPNTLRRDPCKTEEEALKRIYNLLRPGDPPSVETARTLLERLFFSTRRYDLGRVGRHKINQRMDLSIPMDTTVLTNEDLVAIIEYLLSLRAGNGHTDDIDHLGNRRIRSVGELLENQFSIGLSRMARIIRERMSLQDAEGMMPSDLVNARTISAVIRTFFGSSQLSQFMDQTNPLAELTHKRRLSALGPGGLTRERAGFAVRDVHYTHYGRMCPVETPEGPNIGLISSLCTYARVNEYGFLETPYRVVKKGKATNEIRYLSADIEDRHVIAQANEPLDAAGHLQESTLLARHRGDFPQVKREDVDYMDVSPLQLVSAAAALIPFLENDDANRALMGSNMQRQAVPLLKTEVPIVGTGLERKVAEDSGAVVLAKRAGVVEHVSANTIVVRLPGTSAAEDLFGVGEADEYNMAKFVRSNQDTCINQRPVVVEGQRVKKGDLLADGPATKDGELALGVNLLVAFMPWRGYNFEDAIVVSEAIVKDDRLTSIHIEEFEIQVRDTKRGPEEITREIPNVGEDALKNLDEDGIIMIGAMVRASDILVGKVTPKGETELSPEERLLRAIFGEKAGDVRDASLKAPPGMDGIVVDIKVFSRRERDERSRAEEKKKIDRLRRTRNREIGKIKEARDDRVKELMTDLKAERLADLETGEIVVRKGQKLVSSLLDELDFDYVDWDQSATQEPSVNRKIRRIVDAAWDAIEEVRKKTTKETERISRGDELPPGVVKLVKVYVARKRRLSVGDKVAGRHGNKGVVARILPEEDTPYLPDGTPVEIILNPLGVPSRMNVGQILETHLGWASQALGERAASGVFDGASIDEIKSKLEAAGLPRSGKIPVYDGFTGDLFEHEITVGYIYMMKLSHLVDDKIHARSIGPYSLVTQQPLGGKAQFGGQRFGEMEVWALEAYGAAYALQELLTVKSDDVAGRSRIYEAIVKGENPPSPGVPESFNVLVKELQSLGLDVELEKEDR